MKIILGKIKYFIRKILSIYIQISQRNARLMKEDSSTADNGFVYIVFGESFVKEAIMSIRSLRRFHKEPIAIFTDRIDLLEEMKDQIEFIYSIDPKHKRTKVDFIEKTPFEKTIYLDSDTIIVYEITDIFCLLEKFDICVTFDFARKRKSMSEKIEKYDQIPYAFSEVNGGVFAFRKNEQVVNFLNLWRKYFYVFFAQTNGWDQPSLRVALWESELKMAYLPFEYNIRPKYIIEKIHQNKNILGDFHMKPRIYHMHYSTDVHQGIFAIESLKALEEIAQENAIEVIY